MSNEGLQFPKFYVTAPSPCPYLEGKVERKVFTELVGADAVALNEALGRVGFRRSQSVVYRPACEGCCACVSVRVRACDFRMTKSQKRVMKRNQDLSAQVTPAAVTAEQYELLQAYLGARHSDGSMAEMMIEEYKEMVETTPVSTSLIEYRRHIDQELVAVALTDSLSDGLSMVYSFFNPDLAERSLGTFMILDHLKRVRESCKSFVYLGYWVQGSRKMDYKRNFKPIERLGPEGWYEFREDQAHAP